MFVNQLYKYFEGRIFSELQTEADFLRTVVNNSGITTSIKFISKINTDNRITFISTDGTVIFDNKLNSHSISQLENHNSREEIIEAHQSGIGRISRYSDTMLKKTLYVATVTNSDDIVRISCQQHSVEAIIIGLGKNLIIMFLIAVIISIFLAFFISKRISESINKINLDNPEDSYVYKELKPFTKRISEENFEKKQRETLRQQFTANVSHELKTPLTSISGFAEIMKEGVKQGTVDKKTVIDFSSSIYDESQRMITLVNDIIKLSRLDEQSISLKKEEVSLREIAKDVCGVIQNEAKKKRITLNITGDSGNIKGVPQVIYEMIFNICDNAIKYNKEGGNVSIRIKTDQTGNKVSVSVRDTGIGISEKEQERIFERFYRIDNSRSKELGGTGLGLSIVKHGAKYHGAEIKVNSESGRGTEFTIIFVP